MWPTCIALRGERECKAQVRVPTLLDPAEGVPLAQSVLSKHFWSFIFKLMFIHNRSTLWFLYVRFFLLCQRCFLFSFSFFLFIFFSPFFRTENKYYVPFLSHIYRYFRYYDRVWAGLRKTRLLWCITCTRHTSWCTTHGRLCTRRCTLPAQYKQYDVHIYNIDMYTRNTKVTSLK